MRAIHNDELTINGRLFKAKDLYTKKQMRTYGRWVRSKLCLGLVLPMILNIFPRDRIWTGPDGREYRWKMLDEKLEVGFDQVPEAFHY